LPRRGHRRRQIGHVGESDLGKVRDSLAHLLLIRDSIRYLARRDEGIMQRGKARWAQSPSFLFGPA
jgi:hypothetical protein